MCVSCWSGWQCGSRGWVPGRCLHYLCRQHGPGCCGKGSGAAAYWRRLASVRVIETVVVFQQALDGFLLLVTSDGTILYVSTNILQHLGFNQVDLKLRCMYGIVHPDDHQELKMVLEHTLNGNLPKTSGQQRPCCLESSSDSCSAPCRKVSFLCRMKCFNGTTTGYLKMHCVGHMRSFPTVTKSQRTSNQVLFAFCRPFLSLTSDPKSSSGVTCRDNRSNSTGLWTKHGLDLRFKQMDPKVHEVLGYEPDKLEGTSFYELVHPEDLSVFKSCHKALIHTEEIQTMYFRTQHHDGTWVWLHTRGKVVFKNSKKYSIVFTHCPVREEDSTYIQQEAVLRSRYALQELMWGHHANDLPAHGNHFQMMFHESYHEDGGQSYPVSQQGLYGGLKEDASNASLHDPHGLCPSSWHTSADRHSPVFPNTQASQLMEEASLVPAKRPRLEQSYMYTDYQTQECHPWPTEGYYHPQHGNYYQDYNNYGYYGNNIWPEQNHFSGNWQMPCTMVIEGRLTINTNQVQNSCCYSSQNYYPPMATPCSYGNHYDNSCAYNADIPKAPTTSNSHIYQSYSCLDSGYAYPEISSCVAAPTSSKKEVPTHKLTDCRHQKPHSSCAIANTNTNFMHGQSTLGQKSHGDSQHKRLPQTGTQCALPEYTGQY